MDEKRILQVMIVDVAIALVFQIPVDIAVLKLSGHPLSSGDE